MEKFSVLITKRLKHRGGTRVQGHWTGWAYNSYQLEGFIRIVDRLDFGCDFNKVGCNRFKNSSLSGFAKQQGCCGGCRDYLGHFSDMKPSIEICKSMDKYWQGDTGFWQEGVGCALPRKYRSATCTTYYCSDVKPTTLTYTLMCLLRQLFCNQYKRTSKLIRRTNSKLFMSMYATTKHL